MASHDTHEHHPAMNSTFASRHELEAMCYYVHDILNFMPDLQDTLDDILDKLGDIHETLRDA
ncbi:MAG: hypothetical protein ACYS7Y_36285 [Planctomycetota bacterium]|jgi:hypothetical protein